MTQYVTTEPKVQCGLCTIVCTIRELEDGGKCPNCGKLVYILTVIQSRQRREDNERTNITTV